MTYRLSEEQREFRDTLRRFFDEHSPEAEVRRLMETGLGYDAATWKLMSEDLGLPGLAIDEAYGGQGFGPLELGLALGETGRCLLCAPFFSTAVLAASAAVRTMQLTLARAGKTARPATDAFDQKEVEVLRHLQPTLEGKTGKQRNPDPLESLAWAAWIIARLGGWKGYACERKPGPITMLHGLKGFSSIHQGWSIARSENRKDVCIR